MQLSTLYVYNLNNLIFKHSTKAECHCLAEQKWNRWKLYRRYTFDEKFTFQMLFHERKNRHCTDNWWPKFHQASINIPHISNDIYIYIYIWRDVGAVHSNNYIIATRRDCHYNFTGRVHRNRPLDDYTRFQRQFEWHCSQQLES